MQNIILIYTNLFEHLLILAPTVTGCVSISVFGSLFCFPVGIANSDVRIKSLQKLKSISEL